MNRRGKDKAANAKLTSFLQRDRKRTKRVVNGHVSKGAIKRLARRGGVKRISSLIYNTARGMLRLYLESVIKDAIILSDYSKRKTVMAEDVIRALRCRGKRLYGFDEPPFQISRRSPARRNDDDALTVDETDFFSPESAPQSDQYVTRSSSRFINNNESTSGRMDTSARNLRSHDSEEIASTSRSNSGRDNNEWTSRARKSSTVRAQLPESVPSIFRSSSSIISDTESDMRIEDTSDRNLRSHDSKEIASTSLIEDSIEEDLPDLESLPSISMSHSIYTNTKGIGKRTMENRKGYEYDSDSTVENLDSFQIKSSSSKKRENTDSSHNTDSKRAIRSDKGSKMRTKNSKTKSIVSPTLRNSKSRVSSKENTNDSDSIIENATVSRKSPGNPLSVKTGREVDIDSEDDFDLPSSLPRRR